MSKPLNKYRKVIHVSSGDGSTTICGLSFAPFSLSIGEWQRWRKTVLRVKYSPCKNCHKVIVSIEEAMDEE